MFLPGDTYRLSNLDNISDINDIEYHCVITKVNTRYVHYRWLDGEGGLNGDGKDHSSIGFFEANFCKLWNFEQELDQL